MNSSFKMEPFEKIYDVDYEPCDSDSVRGSDSSDDCLEDFENEMQEELDKRVGLKRTQKKARQQTGPSSSARAGQPDTGTSRGRESPSKSGDDDGSCPAEESKRTAAEEANDDAFYDPDEDEDNERWAQRQRQKHFHPDPSQRTPPLPNSDAVLNCPGCMTVLCRDCQAHETNAGQYRAMFVSDCNADLTVEVPGPLVNKRGAKKRRRGGRDPEPGAGNDDMVFHPVHCNFCQTRVGVVDNDEVYHFLYVLAS